MFFDVFRVSIKELLTIMGRYILKNGGSTALSALLKQAFQLHSFDQAACSNFLAVALTEFA